MSWIARSAAPLAAMAAVAGAGVPADAGADTRRRDYQQNAAAYCQGALPAFAGTLRARPLGLGNEGGATAFVSCSFPRAGFFTGPVEALSIRMFNGTAAAVTPSCTGVFGSQTGSTAYITMAVTVPPGQSRNMLWTAADNGDAPLPGPANASCVLAPGVAILDTTNYFYVDVGD